MTVLVTGASGKVGRRLVNSLDTRGASFVAATRHPGVDDRTVKFDWTQPQTWSPALKGISRVWIVPQASGVYDVGSEVCRFVDVAMEHQVECFGLLSVRNAESLSELPALRVERHLERLPVAWFSLRPTWFFQNFTEGMFARRISNAGELIAPANDGRVAFVDVVDVALAAANALSADSPTEGVFEATGPESLSFNDVAKAMAKASHRDIRYLDVSEAAMSKYLSELGLAPAHVAALVHHFARIRQGVVEAVDPHWEKLLGRPPRTLSQFLTAGGDGR